jgi:hypothetical protein
MSLPETIQRIYHELALRYERQQEQRLRDVFLLLAADVARASGRDDEAERLHRQMLEANPNSLLRPFATFADALQSLDIQDYLADLRRQFPPEEAEKLLLKVRANPLGHPREPPRTLSQRDTQEVIPPTARTVNMPQAKPLRANRIAAAADQRIGVGRECDGVLVLPFGADGPRFGDLVASSAVMGPGLENLNSP